MQLWVKSVGSSATSSANIETQPRQSRGGPPDRMATPGVGQDIEALCGRCGQVWHVVMAKMGDRIAKVVCKRCGGHHRYRDENAGAEAERGRGGGRAERRRRGAPSRRARGRRSAAPLPAVRSRPSRRAPTRRATATSPASGSRTRPSASAWSPARPGAGKVEVVFPSGARVLACAKVDLDAGAAGRHRRICRSPTARRSEARRPARASSCASASTRTIRGGHPWIYRDALAGAPRLARWRARRWSPTRDGRPLALGFWDARSPIAVRILERGARPRRRSGGAGRRARRGGAGAAAGVHRPARDRRLPLDPRRGRRRCPACTSTSTATRASCATTATGARAFYRDLPERLRPRRRRGRHGAATPSSSGGARGAAATPRPTRPASCSARARGRDRGARERAALRRRPAARTEGRAVPRPARQPRAGADAGARPARAEPVRLHGRLLDLRGGGRRARDRRPSTWPRRPSRRRAATSSATACRPTARASWPATRSRSSSGAARDGERFDLVISDPPSFAPSRRALAAGPARLPAPAPPVRGGHRAGRDAVRGLVLEPRRPRRVPRHRPRRRARRRPPVRAARAARRRRPTTRSCRNFRRATT